MMFTLIAVLLFGAEINLTDKDNSKTIILTKGDFVNVKLDKPSGTVNNWQMRENKHFSVEKKTQVRKDSGYTSFRLKALNSGKTDLNFDLRGKKAKTRTLVFSFDIK